MIKKETITKITENEDGTQNVETTSKETTYDKGREPDYIKVYTKMWCTFKGVPDSYSKLFIELATRMSYCNSNDLTHSQMVNTGKPWADDIIKSCGWKSEESLKKGLKALVKANAIKRVGRGVYQINPEYAGRGSWIYNANQDQGGVKDLITTFNFVENTCDTNIVWADNGEDTDVNRFYRKMLSERSYVDEKAPTEMQLKRFKGKF